METALKIQFFKIQLFIENPYVNCLLRKGRSSHDHDNVWLQT